MSAGWVLLGLLALAFVGSSIARGRGVSGFGLPSGSEWLIGGVLVGPQMFGVVKSRGLEGFEPLLAVGSGWIALSAGQRLALSGKETWARSGRGSTGKLLGLTIALLSAVAVAIPAFLALTYLSSETLLVRIGTALYLGIALAGSTRQLLDWAIERLGAKGPLTSQLDEVIGSGELVSLLGTAPLTVLVASNVQDLRAMVILALLPVGVGLAFGKLGAVLLRVEVRVAETWAILLGILLLSVGISMRFGASVVATGLVLGWALGRDSRTGREIHMLVQPTEGTVLLPLLVVAGAKVDWLALGALGWVVAGAVLVRLLAKVLGSRYLLRYFCGEPTQALPIGATLSTTGETAILIGVAYWLSVRGELGPIVLATAVAGAFAGEFWGAWGIRSALLLARELSLGVVESARRSSGPPKDLPREPA